LAKYRRWLKPKKKAIVSGLSESLINIYIFLFIIL
jgi:hypothetical protein